MFINDLESEVTISDRLITGAAKASAGGYTYASYGFASADGYGDAKGYKTYTYIDTHADINVGPGFSSSQGNAKVTSGAKDDKGFAKADFFSSSTFLGSQGSSSTRNLTFGIHYSSGR